MRRRQADFETEVDLDIDAYMPAGYVRNESQKLDIYKRIAGIENDEDYMDMQDELIDRFGELPKPVQNLLAVAALKVKAHRVYVKELVEQPDEIRLLLYEKARLNPAAFPAFLAEYGGRMKFVTGEKPGLFYRRQKNSRGEEENAGQLMNAILDTMRECGRTEDENYQRKIESTGEQPCLCCALCWLSAAARDRKKRRGILMRRAVRSGSPSRRRYDISGGSRILYADAAGAVGV
ncbi:MAG: TRCF domain-containing protein [Eubacteriales bacterium]